MDVAAAVSNALFTRATDAAYSLPCNTYKRDSLLYGTYIIAHLCLHTAAVAVYYDLHQDRDAALVIRI